MLLVAHERDRRPWDEGMEGAVPDDDLMVMKLDRRLFRSIPGKYSLVD